MSEINKQCILAKTKAAFEARLAAGDVKNTSIAFIEDSDQIWTQGKYYSVVPKEGHSGQILTWKDSGEAKWEDLASVFTGLEEILAYGVQFDSTVSDPHLTRIGNMSLHKSLPIQSQLKGCIAQDTEIKYWLNESDWRFRKEAITQDMTLTCLYDTYTLTADIFSTLQYKKQWVKIDSTACQINSIDTTTKVATLVPNEYLQGLPDQSSTVTVELGAVLNGYDGTVRVYCPSFYIKSVTEGTVSKVWLSTMKIDNSYTYQPSILADAYRSTLLRYVPENMGYLSTLPANSAISVVNTETYCRGGSNDSSYDSYLDTDPFRTNLGKPATYITRGNMREYCRNSNSYMLSYDQYKNIFYWLWVVEYANFNSQEAFNTSLTDEGYHQGGMNAGVTSWDWTSWGNYNNHNPITPCGYCNTLGNGSGVMYLTIPECEGSTGNTIDSKLFYVPRWRGFDNPFGDIWTNLDGIVVSNNTVYTCQDPDQYADTVTADYKKVGEVYNSNGYITSFDLGDAAHIIPSKNGGNTTLYMCDYLYQGSGTNTLFVGGSAVNGACAGLGCFYSCSGVGVRDMNFGFRAVSGFLSVLS